MGYTLFTYRNLKELRKIQEEREVFFNTLNQNDIDFIHYDNLKECLSETYKKAGKNDIILLIGAQGMDPAESLLNEII